MRKIVLLAALVCITISIRVVAQSSEEPEFKVSAVPDKWKNESAVILAQKIDYAYVRKSMANAMTIKEYVRKRIRLQDKNALENFSEFYYVLYGKKTDVAYSVIKTNGKVVNIDLTNAIEVNKDVPGVFKPIYFTTNTSFYKLAIPDLEVGDIIDYHYESTEDIALQKGYGEFTPYIFTLTYNYPVLYQKFQFELDKGTNAMFKSYNGAPKLREGDDGYDTKASDKKSLVSYSIIDKNREKVSDERWNYPYRNSPTVKLKITYNGGGLSNTLFGKKGEASADAVDLERLKAMFASIQYYQNPISDAMAKDVIEYLKNTGKENLPPKQMVREVYYALRKSFLEVYYKGASDNASLYGSKKRYATKDVKKDNTQKQDEVRMNKLLWAAALIKICGVESINIESVAVMPRYLGKWNDMLFEEELELALRLKGDKYYLLLPFNNFDSFAQGYESFDGCDAYSFGLLGGEGYYKANIPASTSNDNTSLNNISLSVSDGMDVLNVERTSTYAGIEKNDIIGLAHMDREYLNKDFQKYIVNPKKNKGDNTYTDAEKDDRIKKQKEYFQERIEKDGFEVNKYDGFNLIQDGRFDDSPILSFKENYSLKKMVNKAGRNYLLDLGKLIGSQIKLDENEMKTRQNDIWLAYARTISNNITLDIPKGYIVEGFQDLNMSIDNESGSFVSTAKVDGDKLVVSTKKVYKKNFDKKEQWPNYVAFLEAGFKFSQSKVVLKKQ